MSSHPTSARPTETPVARPFRPAAAAGQANQRMYHSRGLRLMQRAFSLVERVSPGVAGRLAYERFVIPPRFTAPERERALVARAERFAIPHPDGDLAGYAWGEAGPVVLLVHGWAGRGPQLGPFVDPLIASGFRVVAFDAPAHGESPGLRTNLPACTQAVIAAADTVWPVHAVVAHSFGAACATAALAEGLVAERVVYLGAWSEPTEILARFAALFALSDTVRDDIGRRLQERFGAGVLERYSAYRVAPRLGAKALLLHDTTDEDVPLAQSEGLAALWPGARLVTTSGLGHRRILRDADVIAQAVAFIAEGITTNDGDGRIATVE